MRIAEWEVGVVIAWFLRGWLWSVNVAGDFDAINSDGDDCDGECRGEDDFHVVFLRG